ncbi:unnamed protein product [Hermetia illucens]|uniref:TRAF3-interacting protein 1 n=1 Tax=Hermetia illucens TaxID=343691 RepID=A0A7R8Z2T8_HERIL|nr:TRAF3-interacting protein 1 [Hermetia illucens]CAD7091247.1 unnamed protein product [Hermetia illucens]
MSENNVDPAVIKKTQESLGKFVKKPALTEKLLNKPPFRFIHDIVNAIIKETGFLEGLYSKTELISENIKDRDAKINFLQKLIDVIKLTTSKNISARPSKIVAGHEAEKTNELLQLIGFAIENKLDYKQAIETLKTQGSTGKTKSISKEKPRVNHSKEGNAKENKPTTKKDDNKDKKSSKTQPAKSTNIKNATGKTVAASKTSSKTTTKGKDAARPSEKKIEKEIKSELEETKPVKNEGKAKSEEKPDALLSSQDKVVTPTVSENDIPQKSKRNSAENIISNEINNNKELNGVISADKEARKSVDTESALLPPPSDKGEPPVELANGESNKPKEPTGEQKDTKEPKERKKSSSKRRKSVAEESISSATERSKGSSQKVGKETSTPGSRKPSDPLLDISQQSLKDTPTPSPTDVRRQSTFVREGSQNDTTNARPRTSLRPPSVRPASARPGAPRRRDKNVEIILQPNDQMKLAGINVKLETFESQLEDDGENLVIVESVVHESDKKDDDTKIALDEESQQGHLVQQILQTQKELTQLDSETGTVTKRQSSARQMDSLRDVIQNLTRSINPLGKLMDFLPEDIDSMHLELNMWRDSYIQGSSELKKERSLTESAIEPMRNQLAQINANIKEYKDMIEQIRAKILQNSDKIHKLLADQ